MLGEVTLLGKTAEALDGLVCSVERVNLNLPEMAWLVLVCKFLPDEERYFPHGKWSTIQSIENQIDLAAQAEAKRRTRGGDNDQRG